MCDFYSVCLADTMVGKILVGLKKGNENSTLNKLYH